jgi:hypothetical protein
VVVTLDVERLAPASVDAVTSANERFGVNVIEQGTLNRLTSGRHAEKS